MQTENVSAATASEMGMRWQIAGLQVVVKRVKVRSGGLIKRKRKGKKRQMLLMKGEMNYPMSYSRNV
jgi:hypothetical protein